MSTAHTLLSRRRLLVGGAAAALLVTVYPLLRQLGGRAEEGPYRHLTPRTAAIFSVLGDFLSPPGGPLPGSAGDAATLERIDMILEHVPAETRRLVLALPLVFEHGTALDRYGARTLTRLGPERRASYLLRWARADDLLRAQLFTALRTIFGMAYFERPEVVRAMGIAPACWIGP